MQVYFNTSEMAYLNSFTSQGINMQNKKKLSIEFYEF